MAKLDTFITAGVLFARHWRDIGGEALADWLDRWPNFTPEEVACRGDGELKLNLAAMDRLQALRNRIGRPLILNSAYRSLAYNKKVGGVPGSIHTKGAAFDVSMLNHDPEEFARLARAGGFTGVGFYPPGKGNFVHIDTMDGDTWGKPWKAPRFQPQKANGRPLGFKDV